MILTPSPTLAIHSLISVAISIPLNLPNTQLPAHSISAGPFHSVLGSVCSIIYQLAFKLSLLSYSCHNLALIEMWFPPDDTVSLDVLCRFSCTFTHTQLTKHGGGARILLLLMATSRLSLYHHHSVMYSLWGSFIPTLLPNLYSGNYY